MRTKLRPIVLLVVSTLVTLVTPHVAAAQVPEVSVPVSVWTTRDIYTSKISEIRAAVAPLRRLPVPRLGGQTIPGRVSPRIDTKRQYTVADFIRVHFARINGDTDAPSFDVLLRKDDLYIVGWYNDQVAIDAQQGKGETPVERNRRLPSGVWPNPDLVTEWPLSTNYSKLCNTAMEDGTLKLGSNQLQQALKNLGQQVGSKYDSTSLCVLAVTISEAVRFRAVSYTVQKSWPATVDLGVRQTLCIKKWKDMTQFLFWARGKGGPFNVETLGLDNKGVHLYNRKNQLTTSDSPFDDAIAVFHGSGKAEAEAAVAR
ncbi:MAG: hypothetical protein HOV94_00760 [Saccharothrix sp.]|nr:hypothetical protein [Saccharothrix sp.]